MHGEQVEREKRFVYGRWVCRFNERERCIDVHHGLIIVDALNEIGWSEDNRIKGSHLFIPKRAREGAERLYRRFFDLKPCPFWGAKTARYDDSSGACEVDCRTCGAYVYGSSPKAAVKAWNRRVS